MQPVIGRRFVLWTYAPSAGQKENPLCYTQIKAAALNALWRRTGFDVLLAFKGMTSGLAG